MDTEERLDNLEASIEALVRKIHLQELDRVKLKYTISGGTEIVRAISLINEGLIILKGLK